MNTAEIMSSAGIKKFLFDNDFTNLEPILPAPEEAKEQDEAAEMELAVKEEEVEVEEEVVIPTFSEEDVNRAREEGTQHGRDEALKDMEGSLQKKLAETMQVLEQKLDGITNEQLAQKDGKVRNAAAVAAVIVRKLFPSLNMDKAMDEINHMIEQALKKTSGETKMVFSVASEIKDDVENKVAEMVALSGREIDFKVVGSADIKMGDCTIEWSGGGLIRDQDQMWREIDEIVERNLGSLPGDSMVHDGTLDSETNDKISTETNDKISDETNDGNPL